MRQSIAFLGSLMALFATLDLSTSFQSSGSSSSSSSSSITFPSSKQHQHQHQHQHQQLCRRGPWCRDNERHSTTSSTQLSVSPLTTIASSPIGAITVLASIVLIHEAGHYLAARSFNISVVEFSIGFGPKLLGFEAIGNEFNLRALPLGGYVRFPENYNTTEVDSLRTAAREAFSQRRQAENWTAWQETLNLLTLGVWDEQRRQARKKEQAKAALSTSSSSSSSSNSQSSWWRKILPAKKVKQEPRSDPEDFEIPYFDDPNLLQNRPWPERAVVLSGGVVFNMILAWVLYFGEINFGPGIPQPIFDSGVVVSQVPRADGASAGLLRQGDVILGINGQPIVMTSQNPKGAQKQVSDVIGAIRDTPSGESVKLQVKRDTKELDVMIQPQSNTASQKTIGVFLGPNFKEIQKIQSNDVVESAVLAYRYLSQMISQTLDGLLSLLGMMLMGKGPPPGQSVSGPIGLIRSGSEIVSTRDVTAVLLFAAALSVNLGVINALPLPALDGGQLVFVLAEAVTGKKVNQQLQEGITSVAILLLLFVSVSTAFGDVSSIINGR